MKLLQTISPAARLHPSVLIALCCVSVLSCGSPDTPAGQMQRHLGSVGLLISSKYADVLPF